MASITYCRKVDFRAANQWEEPMEQRRPASAVFSNGGPAVLTLALSLWRCQRSKRWPWRRVLCCASLCCSPKCSYHGGGRMLPSVRRVRPVSSYPWKMSSHRSTADLCITVNSFLTLIAVIKRVFCWFTPLFAVSTYMQLYILPEGGAKHWLNNPWRNICGVNFNSMFIFFKISFGKIWSTSVYNKNWK